MLRLMIALPLVVAWQEKTDYEFSWDLPPDVAADYAVFDTSREAGVLRKDRFFMVFGADLKRDGGNHLLINTYEDVPWSFVFTLPKGKVKVGSRWSVERNLFEKAGDAASPAWAFQPVAVRGSLAFRKIEKIDGIACARVDGAYQVFAMKTDTRSGVRTATTREIAQFSTSAWFSLGRTLLVRGRYRYKGRIEEYRQGFKRGDEARSRSLSLGERIELKKDLVQIDHLLHRDRIHSAIRNGVGALRRLQRKDGTWRIEEPPFFHDFPTGMTALAVMALLHSGVAADDPQVRAALTHVRTAPFRKVYEVASTIMALESRYLPLEKFQDIQELTESGARESIAASITAEDLAFLRKAADWLVMQQTQEGTWGYPEGSDLYDHSNTQYALLALKSASRCGVKIGAEVWRRAADHWIRFQKAFPPEVALRITWLSEAEAGVDTTRAEERCKQGAWGYFTSRDSSWLLPDRGYGSMTCAGLTSLIIAESELTRLKELDDPMRRSIDLAKKQGLAWLQENFSVRGCPPETGFWSVFYTYYLFSVERVGVLYGIRKFADHDWYQEGALALVHRQRMDGSWNLYVDVPVLDTAFALLFLKKATVRVSTQAAGTK